MAIFDNDGSATREVGKVWDNDGTATHQIGKVWDDDGSGVHLVYLAEYNAMDETWTVSGTGTTGGDFAYINTQAQKSITLPDGAYGWTGFYIPVDLSQYSKVTVSFSHSGAYTSNSFGLSTVSTPYDDMNIAQLYQYDSQSDSSQKVFTDIVYDLTQYSQTTAFFKMYIYVGSAGGDKNFTITKLIFE